MNFLKKSHPIVGQNEKGEKKPHKHDANLQKNTTLYFQVGLILCLLFSYGLLETQFEKSIIPIDQGTLIDDSNVFEDSVIFIAEPDAIIEPDPIVKRKLINEIIEIDNDTAIKEVENDIITEPESQKTTSNLMPESLDVFEEPEDLPVDFISIEQSPIFHGCERFSKEEKRKKCFSDKVNKIVARNFDTNLVGDLGLNGKYRINVQFKIDKTGDVTQVKARAAHPQLEKEAKKTVKKLPKMKPGIQNGKQVDVIFSLPIVVKGEN